MHKVKTLLLFLLLGHLLYAQGQKPAFGDDIKAFKQQDSLSFPQKNAILFIGSSTFTMWKDVQDYFPDHMIINRGFGGSSLTDVIRYEADIIFSYQPKQIVIYCGENDLAGSDTVTGQMVFKRFKQLFADIKEKLPEVPVMYISIKPSPSRWHLKEKMITANELIRKYLRKKKQAVFISVWKQMLGPDGKPWDALFGEDKLHMNARGYTLWQKLIAPHLLK